MVLKELEIQGFKSFANKTRVSFKDSITAVVGPNGCGKSNILDALKWVLGEKSVKSMRGEKMEDVIFSGTEAVKASGFAEVSLLLDNTKRFFDIDIDTVKIGRRLYRDGQSQYLLNDKRVSRKEIDLLLMDTGIGKSSYSFMEQGRIDQILSVKPEERRKIFEEAAGISKYKNQKEEAEKNLENTQHNIVRLQDILHELERELTSKKKQADKTKIYNELLASQREFDLRLRYSTLVEIQKKNEELERKLQRKQKEKDKIQQKYYLLEEKINILQEEKEKLQKQLHEKDIKNRINKEKVEQWSEEIHNIKIRRKEFIEQKENFNSQMNKQEKRIEDLKNELNKQNQFTIDLISQLDQAENFLVNISNEIEHIKKEIKDLEDNLLVTIRKEKQSKIKLFEKREELEVSITQLLDSLKVEKEKWPTFEEKLNQNKNTIIKLIESCQSNIQSLNVEKDKKELSQTIEELNSSLTESNLIDKIKTLGELPQGLKHLLFEQGGLYSQKQKIDEQIESIIKQNEEYENKKIALQAEISYKKEFLSKKMHEREKVVGDIKSIKLQKTNLIEKESNLKKSLSHEENSLNYLKSQYNKIEEQLIEINNKEKSLSENIETKKTGLQKELIQIDTIEKKIKKSDEKKNQILSTLQLEKPKLEKINSSLNELEIQIGTYLASQEALVQELYNDYNLTLIEVKEKLKNARIIASKDRAKLVEIQKKIQELGAINPLAIDELEAVNSLYDHNKTQLDDIIKAKKDILDIIDSIQKKSEEMFLTSFKQISQNFEKTFKTLFNGGKVSLTLQEEDKPLTTGIDIIVQPPGKKARSLLLLSGGEKTMTAISLMFAIYMVKSSPFCVLDEIDAPLDDQNLKRFLLILDDFVENTQFILITHNKLTMAKADSLFGVTMEQAGISKLLSVNLATAEKTATK